MGDTVPPLPKPVGVSQITMHSAPELTLGNGRSGDVAVDGPSYSAGSARPNRPGVGHSAMPHHPATGPPRSASASASAAPPPPPHSMAAVTNGHYRPPSTAGAADPARKYAAPAPAPSPAPVQPPPQPQPQQPLAKAMEPLTVSEPPLRRFKATKDEVVGDDVQRRQNKKLCCTIM